jgi:cytochrome b
VKQRVWDLPTRLFHWSLVLLIGLSWWTAETDQDDLHLWLGYGVLFLLVFRVLWGFLGSEIRVLVADDAGNFSGADIHL